LGAGRVERWVYSDSEGFVYGHPSIVEVDVVIRDREHVLVEVKASVSKGDVLELVRIIQIYEKVAGVKPRLAIISPYIDPGARQLARSLGVEVYAP
jgi:hypothetical protein